jgi:hypothetical protein
MTTEWRRKHKRISCFVPSLLNIAVVIKKSDSKLEDSWGIIHNISMGGIKLETRAAAQVGETVNLSFSISNNFTFVNARGRVKRVEFQDYYYTLGIEFESLVDQKHLQEALLFLAES